MRDQDGRYRYPGAPVPRRPAAGHPALFAHLTCLGYRRRFALVAIDPATGRGVAIARYEPAGDDTGEVAIAVSHSWRHVGLATALVSLLAQAALERGVVTFTASYLAANRPVAALVEDAGGLSRKVIEQGIAEFSVALDHPDTTAARAKPTRPGPGNQPGRARHGHSPGHQNRRPHPRPQTQAQEGPKTRAESHAPGRPNRPRHAGSSRSPGR